MLVGLLVLSAWKRFSIRKVAVDVGLIVAIPANVRAFQEQLPLSRYIECNIPKAEAFVRKYGLDSSEAAIDFYSKAKQVFIAGKQVLDRIGVPFWLSSGTCLGELKACHTSQQQLPMTVTGGTADYGQCVAMRLCCVLELYNL